MIDKNFYVFLEDKVPDGLINFIDNKKNVCIVSNHKPEKVLLYLDKYNIKYDFIHLEQDSIIESVIQDYTRITSSFRRLFCNTVPKEYTKFWWLTSPAFMHPSKTLYNYIYINKFIDLFMTPSSMFWVFAPHSSKYIVQPNDHTIVIPTSLGIENFKKTIKSYFTILVKGGGILIYSKGYSFLRLLKKNISEKLNKDIMFVCWGWWIKNNNNIVVDQYYGELPIYLSKKYDISLAALYRLQTPSFIRKDKIKLDTVVPRLFLSTFKAMGLVAYFSYKVSTLTLSHSLSDNNKFQLLDFLLNVHVFFHGIASYYDWLFFFETNKLKAIFFYDKIYLKGRALTLAVRSLKINQPIMLGICHGAYTKFSPMFYGDNGDEGFPFPVQDIIFVNDLIAKETFDWMAKYTPECNVLVSGIHTISEKYVENWNIRELDDKKPIILFIASNFLTIKDVWHQLVDLSNKTNIQLIFRPHPGWLPPQEEIFKFGKENKQSKIIYDEKLDIDRQISAADWILAFGSSSLYSCIKYDKPIYIISMQGIFDPHRKVGRFSKFDNINYISSTVELEEVVCYMSKNKPINIADSSVGLISKPKFGKDSMDIIEKALSKELKKI